MNHTINIIVYPAQDLEAAKKAFGTFLGVEPYADAPYYVGYKVGELEIGLDPRGQAVVSYMEVEDIQASLQSMLEAGATLQQDAKDVGGGLLVAQVKDANGNILGFRQAPK